MSYSANRFASMHTVALGCAAYMGIAASERSRLETSNLLTQEMQDTYAALYATRFASVATRGLARTDCLDLTTVHVYATPRAYRKAAIKQHAV